jgi:hypothetical protein
MVRDCFQGIELRATQCIEKASSISRRKIGNLSMRTEWLKRRRAQSP